MLRLKAGRSKSVRLKFTYPATLNGAFHLIGVVQTADGINDGDPANNAKASISVVTVLPRTVDFTAAFREPTPTLFSATRKSSVVVDVANLGSISYSGHVTLRVRASADNVSSPDDITLFEATPRLRLLPGHTRPVHLKFAALPNLPAGTYFQVVDVDPASAITESDEFNNTGVSATAFSLV